MLWPASTQLDLLKLLVSGVAYHHAGLSKQARLLVETQLLSLASVERALLCFIPVEPELSRSLKEIAA